ncbi:MAG: hypothetical protein PHI49_06705 [Halothiobacillaceae bacterium]|nr:hypothetical protein [Halothiobacillaceae bacterium]
MSNHATPAQLAALLLARFRPYFPAVAAQTRSELDAKNWLKAWGDFIENERLTADEVMRGLSKIARVEPGQPLTPAVFLRLARPDFDHKSMAYAPAPRALPRGEEERERRRKVAAHHLMIMREALSKRA